jgi:hypothetical protein
MTPKVKQIIKYGTLLILAIPIITGAATVWTGPQQSFSDADQPDMITPNVWLMRGSSQGLYNSATESGFTHFFSPADTEWANGTTANYATLSYTDWNTWSKNINGGPPDTVGVPAVVHLISDDIYIDITFTSWSSGGSGGYSYERSTPAVVPPTPPVFQSFMKSGDTMTLTWSATATQNYQLQYTTNLTSATWINVGNLISATGATVTAIDTNATEAFPQRFYRVAQIVTP